MFDNVQVTDIEKLAEIRAQIAADPDSPRSRLLQIIADAAEVFIESQRQAEAEVRSE